MSSYRYSYITAGRYIYLLVFLVVNNLSTCQQSLFFHTYYPIPSW